MYKIPKYSKTMIVTKPRVEGETIETECKRILVNKEPIKDGAPLIYTERKDGVNAAYNIRTDRFELAAEAHDKITKSKQAKREEIAKLKDKKEGDGEAEPTHGKDGSK